ncbi:MAG: hypothetical protein ACKO8Q_01940, partial [Bacteroidota bacterium]
PESLFEKKGGSFSVVSYHPNNRIELSIFESAFWNRYRNGVIQSPDWLYYSPVPMTGVSQFFSSRNSANIGLDVNFRITKKWLVYSQVGGMNLPNEKLGVNYQFGLRGFNFIVPNLSVQVEWNQVDPFSYSLNNKTANAVHMNQNIGHPLENCSEKILRVQYRYGRWLVNGKLNLVDQLVQRPIIDGFENGKRQLSQWEIQASYWFNPKTNSQIFLQYADRIDKYEYSNSNFGYHSSWLSFGIRSNLHAIYQDF